MGSTASGIKTSIYALFMAYSQHEEQASQELHSTRTNLETNARSPPTSQTSSLDDSRDSQLSHVRPDAAGDTDLVRPHGAMTISTSFSTKSSQKGTDRPYLVKPDASTMDQNEMVDWSVAEDPLDKDHTSATERTANGEAKSSESSLPTSLTELSRYKHSRNSSRTSRISQIGELSNHLRTRLSYAMVKVQNGWESHNLSELESMTSSQASPVSAVFDAHRLHECHVSSNVSADISTSMQQSKQVTAAPGYAHLSPRNSASISENVSEYRQQGTFDPSSRRIEVGAAYESFWRDHEAGCVSRPIEPPIVGPSLEPPANIVAHPPRRSDFMKKQPPPLRTDSLGTTSAPVTPPPNKHSKIRTPSQQAEVEKDAVETLLFMSSPGNSGYHPPGAFPGTPLRNQFERHTDRIDGLGLARPDQARHRYEQRRLSYSQHLRSPARKRPLSNAEMDKILDEMPDTSSSDDSELQDKRPLET